jgi:hypothetical protein
MAKDVMGGNFKEFDGLSGENAGRNMKRYKYPAKFYEEKKKRYLICLGLLRIARDDIA